MELIQRLLPEIAVGAVDCDRQLPVADLDRPSTSVRIAGAGAVVDGEKFYCTGSLAAHWLAVLARDADQIVFQLADATGVTIVDDWTGMDQRTTASGTVRFSDVRLPHPHLAPRRNAVTSPHRYGRSPRPARRHRGRQRFEAQVERAELDPPCGAIRRTQGR